ncbi:MAG TPA: methyltransferase domain-containing protein [Candidatus Limnocylindrales bacterium]|nr:methyltransferase domain-containing protein [Candidatus Limnocylindrales bacterium]
MTTPRRRFCCDDDLARLGYDGRNADADLRRWRERRLNPVTRELIDVILRQGVDGARVLDIGAGVGAVHVALLEAGAGSAVDVDASREYLAVARGEAERRGLRGRVEYRYGDVVELAGALPAADIVTLDSVICCYPYLEPLLAAATSSQPRLVGITYPRDVWWMRAFMWLYDVAQAMLRSPARYFVHRHSELERWMADAGYENVHEGGIRVWRVVLYQRSPGAS